jgi:aryl-alcohol dehydrogenase-like predicted oxidoreductase
MRTRRHRGEALSEIGLGCYALSGAYGKADPERFVGLVRRAYDLGVTVFDTADIYGPAEEVLGRAVAPFRDQVWIASKVGWGAGNRPDCSPGHVRASCEASLQRLGTNHLDLYQIHFHDPDTPIAETVDALQALQAEGKIRYYGVGHLPPERMAEYMAEGQVFSALLELSAVARGALEDRMPLCQDHGVGVIAFSVTGRGLLTGKIGADHAFEEGDIRQIDPLFRRERLASALRVAKRFGALGAKLGRTPVQVAIAWVLAQPQVVCALTGPSKVSHLEENLGGSGWTIPAEDLAALEEYIAVEDERLQREQLRGLRAILTATLAPEDAFTDLVYVLETVAEMGLATEEEILPIFGELMPLRERPPAEVLGPLQAIQGELRRRFLSLVSAADAGPASGAVDTT